MENKGDKLYAGPVAFRRVKESFWSRKNGQDDGSCKNCGEQISGNYCSACGQKTVTKRLRFASTLRNFITAFFHVERGGLRTLWQLFVRPGYMARDYIEEKRKSYINPFSLMVLLAAVYGIFSATMLWVETGEVYRLEAYGGVKFRHKPECVLRAR